MIDAMTALRRRSEVDGHIAKGKRAVVIGQCHGRRVAPGGEDHGTGPELGPQFQQQRGMPAPGTGTRYEHTVPVDAEMMVPGLRLMRIIKNGGALIVEVLRNDGGKVIAKVVQVPVDNTKMLNKKVAIKAESLGNWSIFAEEEGPSLLLPILVAGGIGAAIAAFFIFRK